YLFNLAPKFNLYPLAGFWLGRYSINETIYGIKVKGSDTNFGLNLGVGAEYELTQNLLGFAEFKGVLSDGSRAQFALGVAYKF
ncbi:MAG: porin family protein, partial [Rikenellaceae bacterium]|nr:porin family protein [Rikenellaceae bacterium]